MRKIAGKRALVTGAASGIGRAIALRLAESGVDLLLADINDVGLQQTALDARQRGVDAVAARCDITSRSDVQQLVDLAVDRWAGVDILVNNAGVTYYGPAHSMPEDEWDRVVAINLGGALTLTRGLLPWLLARPQAHVLNVCSILGLVGLPRVALYCTTKFAMVGFSQALRAEYSRQGLGVTALCPGFVKTNLFSAARPMRDGEEPRQPPRFMCTTPERIARCAVSAIRRNRRQVIVEPFAHVAWAAKAFAPGVMDWALRLGEWKRVRRKAARLESLSDDRATAIRLAAEVNPQRSAA